MKIFARNASIWAGIVLVMMAGYVYRIELQDFGSRITANLFSGNPVSATNEDGRASVSIVRASSGHFEVEGDIGGHNVRFLVDTGASSIVLSAEDATDIGIDVSKLSFVYPVSTANGMTTSATTRVARFKIGSIVRKNQFVMVAKPGNLDSSLLGMSFINTLWGFEIRGDRMTFIDE